MIIDVSLKIFFIIYYCVYLPLFFFEQNNFKSTGYLGFEPVTLVSIFISLPFMTKLWQRQLFTHNNRK